jgi:hypothetical protein
MSERMFVRQCGDGCTVPKLSVDFVNFCGELAHHRRLEHLKSPRATMATTTRGAPGTVAVSKEGVPNRT